jgi:prophage regulatory protein
VRRKTVVHGNSGRVPVVDGGVPETSKSTATSSDAGRVRLERLQALPLKFLRFHAVRDRTGLSRSTIWRLERRGEFPRHRRISANAVAWLEDEVNEWVLMKSATG